MSLTTLYETQFVSSLHKRLTKILSLQYREREFADNTNATFSWYYTFFVRQTPNKQRSQKNVFI